MSEYLLLFLEEGIHKFVGISDGIQDNSIRMPQRYPEKGHRENNLKQFPEAEKDNIHDNRSGNSKDAIWHTHHFELMNCHPDGVLSLRLHSGSTFIIFDAVIGHKFRFFYA